MPDQYTLLLELRRSEGAARGLAKLPHDFYGTTTAYLAEVRRTFEGELRENPSGRKGELARQTYQRASQVARDLIEARMTKILSLAFQASIGGGKEVANALPEERTLFDALTDTLHQHRNTVAPYLAPEGWSGPAAAAGAAAPAPTKAARPSTANEPDVPPTTYVRILQDSRPLALAGETIELRREDLLSLPEQTARILIEAKIAERVRPGPLPPGS
jgi:DNA replication initiation complex subunit (GINS family)